MVDRFDKFDNIYVVWGLQKVRRLLESSIPGNMRTDTCVSARKDHENKEWNGGRRNSFYISPSWYYSGISARSENKHGYLQTK